MSNKFETTVEAMQNADNLQQRLGDLYEVSALVSSWSKNARDELVRAIAHDYEKGKVNAMSRLSGLQELQLEILAEIDQAVALEEALNKL